MIEDNKMTQHRESMSHVGAANDANDETIQSEVRPKILTSSSKVSRLLRVEIYLVPRNRFARCR
jgi:hypothetical protein